MNLKIPISFQKPFCLARDNIFKQCFHICDIVVFTTFKQNVLNCSSMIAMGTSSALRCYSCMYKDKKRTLVFFLSFQQFCVFLSATWLVFLKFVLWECVLYCLSFAFYTVVNYLFKICVQNFYISYFQVTGVYLLSHLSFMPTWAVINIKTINFCNFTMLL